MIGAGWVPYKKYLCKFEYKGKIIERSIVVGPYQTFQFTFDCLYPGAKLIKFDEQK
jgi:hypothetical protein